MKRRATKTNPWKPRLSAGGANRTNLNGAMSRIHHHQPDDDGLLMPPRRPAPSGSDLMPAPRPSSFRPFNSRLQPVYYQSPPRYAPQWQPQLPPPSQNYIHPQYSRREAQTVDKRKPIPRKGMFQNAKYSEPPPPPAIDEDQIRHTEEVITRMIEKSRRNYLPQNSMMRDSIRRAVYNLGVPDGYRAAQGPVSQYEEYEEPSRRPQNPRHRHQEFSRHSRGDRGDRGDRREDYEEEEDFELEEDDESVFSPPKKHRKKQKRVEEEYEDDDVEESPPRPSRKVEKQKRKRLEEKEGDTSDEESMLLERSRNSNSSRTSKKKSTPRPPSRGSKSSRNSTPKQPSPVSGPYVKDSDDDDNWKDSLPFMCAPNGAGAAMLERIGSAITTLPLRDDTKNSYSDVAMMLLGKSLKKLQTPRNERDDEDEEGLQSQLMNMSTYWARNPRPPPHHRASEDAEDDEVVAETRKSSDTQLLRDISRIQHPDNISTLQIDQSVFAIPRLLEVDRGIAEDWERGRLRKKKMQPPLFQSSPVSNDDVRRGTEEYGITQPSSIRKGPEEYGIIISDDEEDPKQFDIDDYIARGASQLNFSILTADPDISFFAPPSNNNNDILSPVMSNPQDDINVESYPKSPEPEAREFEIETTSRTKSDHTTNEFNSRFMFSPSRKKRKVVDPMLDIEESVQRIVDEVYDSDQANRQKYLF
ncbi:unnamed protein product [Caenorhabditis brenneri]